MSSVICVVVMLTSMLAVIHNENPLRMEPTLL
jgi:hypothetical protein